MFKQLIEPFITGGKILVYAYGQYWGSVTFIIPLLSTMFLVLIVNIAVEVTLTVGGQKDNEQLRRVSGTKKSGGILYMIG
jgi:hypothetical protein